jgi:uncharacterized protein YicC (UPF0701 family)
MTGFGTAEGSVGTARVTVEVRTVNHRFFNPSIKLPSALSRWEPDVREALRQRVARGHVTLTARAAREGTATSAIDEARVAQEIAILADRLDVSEEVDRFRSHAVAFREALGGTSGEAVGKRLGFLLQEMVREANTTGSKANDAAILADVVTLKEELERMREQVENLE